MGWQLGLKLKLNSFGALWLAISHAEAAIVINKRKYGLKNYILSIRQEKCFVYFKR